MDDIAAVVNILFRASSIAIVIQVNGIVPALPVLDPAEKHLYQGEYATLKHYTGYPYKSTIGKTCLDNCKSCNTYGVCVLCYPGWYGETCNQHCHSNCYTCSRSRECDTCKSSAVFGPLCEQSCEVCNDGACDRARCTRGCVDGYFEALLHEAHIPGISYYHTCVTCPEVCMTCTSKGHCHRCVNMRHWGRNCENICPDTCKRCHHHTGTCLDQCGWGRFRAPSGHCKDCPQNCRSCTSESQCTKCIGQRHGAQCNEVNCSSINNCSECTCTSYLCSKDDVRCSKCDVGYTGDGCDKTSATDNVITTQSYNTYHPKTMPTVHIDKPGTARVYKSADIARDVTNIDNKTAGVIIVCGLLGVPGLFILFSFSIPFIFLDTTYI